MFAHLRVQLHRQGRWTDRTFFSKRWWPMKGTWWKEASWRVVVFFSKDTLVNWCFHVEESCETLILHHWQRSSKFNICHVLEFRPFVVTMSDWALSQEVQLQLRSVQSGVSLSDLVHLSFMTFRLLEPTVPSAVSVVRNCFEAWKMPTFTWVQRLGHYKDADIYEILG